jgi:hypothetical protein
MGGATLLDRPVIVSWEVSWSIRPFGSSSHFLRSAIGGCIGLLFLICRPLYFIGYLKDSKARTAGFVMGFLANVMLVLGSLGGVISSLI